MVDATFKTIFDIKNIDIIDSVIDGGSFTNCNFINCEIKTAHLNNCSVLGTDIYNGKIESCKITDGSSLIDCFMKGGVFRSGKLGQFGEIDKTTKIVTAENNYFGDNKEQSLDDKMKSVGAFQNKSNVDKKKWMNGYNNTRDKNTTF